WGRTAVPNSSLNSRAAWETESRSVISFLLGVMMIVLTPDVGKHAACQDRKPLSENGLCLAFGERECPASDWRPQEGSHTRPDRSGTTRVWRRVYRRRAQPALRITHGRRA